MRFKQNINFTEAAIERAHITLILIFVSKRLAKFIDKQQAGIFPFFKLYPGFNTGSFFRPFSINMDRRIIIMVNDRKGI